MEAITRRRDFWLRLAASAAALAAAALFYRWLCGRHEGGLPSLPAGSDWLLRRLPIVDTGPLLTWGWMGIHAAALAYFLSRQTLRLPYFLATIALFVGVRAVFISLCPLGPPPGMMPLYQGSALSFFRGRFLFDSEMFFSGHTAMPYLYALFCGARSPSMRAAFLACSVAMGAGVLLTRNHYTMDVFGAFFMTFSIYRLSRRWLGWLDPLPEAAEAA